MSKRVTLMELLGHPHTRGAIQQLANGVDPRLVAAQLAGNALSEHVALALGTALPTPRIDSQEPRKKKPSKVTVVKDEDIIDAEYTVINVSPGVKKKVKVG